MTLYLKEGEFGRSGGIFPELGSCKYVSGRHGKLALEDGEWKICDLGSTNGTYVEGHQVPAATLLDGNTITIGRTRILYWASAQAQE